MVRPPYEPPGARVLEGISKQEWVSLCRTADMLGHRDELMELQREVVSERNGLADIHLELARRIQGEGTSGKIDWQKRHAISRAYYAMVHAARALHQAFAGWDETKHQKLPDLISNLGHRELTVALKKARMLRNQADYTACYPRPIGGDARLVVQLAERWVSWCKGQVDARWEELDGRGGTSP